MWWKQCLTNCKLAFILAGQLSIMERFTKLYLALAGIHSSRTRKNLWCVPFSLEKEKVNNQIAFLEGVQSYHCSKDIRFFRAKFINSKNISLFFRRRTSFMSSLVISMTGNWSCASVVTWERRRTLTRWIHWLRPSTKISKMQKTNWTSSPSQAINSATFSKINRNKLLYKCIVYLYFVPRPSFIHPPSQFSRHAVHSPYQYSIGLKKQIKEANIRRWTLKVVFIRPQKNSLSSCFSYLDLNFFFSTIFVTK